MATEEELREEAKNRVTKRRDLGTHLVVYVVVNSMLIGIWAITGAGYFWPAWVLLGWGVGVILNIWDVYFRRPVTEHEVPQDFGGRPHASSHSLLSGRTRSDHIDGRHPRELRLWYHSRRGSIAVRPI